LGGVSLRDEFMSLRMRIWRRVNRDTCGWGEHFLEFMLGGFSKARYPTAELARHVSYEGDKYDTRKLEL
jgi:hypothetical protein